MDSKWIGTVLIVAGCGFWGFSMASRHAILEFSLEELIRGLEYMACELQFHLPPLPELCLSAAARIEGPARDVFQMLAEDLESQESGDVSCSMERVLVGMDSLPEPLRRQFLMLGRGMGRFDLDGQMAGFESVRSSCIQELEKLRKDRDARLNSYRTVGVCTGAAIAILLV